MGGPIELKAVKGVRNDISLERFELEDLAVGNNIDLDEKGKIFRRLGTGRIVAGVMHSLKAFTNTALVVSNGVLSVVNAAGTLLALATGIVARLSYTEIVDSIFWTDGVSTGAISQGANRPWGIVVPALPAVTVGAGDLAAGTYLYTTTYSRSTGLESGAPPVGLVTVPANSSLSFAVAASADPLAQSINIYVSSVNGELSYLSAIVANATQAVKVAALPEQSVPLRTSLMGPPPAGQLLGYYNGRAYVGKGRFLWYSQPYEYELFDLVNGYLAFQAELKTFAPVASGIYLGTATETMYLDGADPSEFVRKQVAPYGTVLGTEFYVRNDLLINENAELTRHPGMTPVWMSQTGLCLGLEGGAMQNLTSDRFVIPSVLAEGASLLKIRSGTPQLVSTIYS